VKRFVTIALLILFLLALSIMPANAARSLQMPLGLVQYGYVYRYHAPPPVAWLEPIQNAWVYTWCENPNTGNFDYIGYDRTWSTGQYVLVIPTLYVDDEYGATCRSKAYNPTKSTYQMQFFSGEWPPDVYVEFVLYY